MPKKLQPMPATLLISDTPPTNPKKYVGWITLQALAEKPYLLAPCPLDAVVVDGHVPLEKLASFGCVIKTAQGDVLQPAVPAVFGKRFFDILGGLVIAAGFCLLFPIIAYFIKKEDGGKIFYRQQRWGKDGSPFFCYKLRTMQENNTTGVEADLPQVTENDARITKTGKFLRKTMLDELPQCWNVLRGEMSLVGCRPHAVAHNIHYAAHIPDYLQRHRIKPGMTGLSQATGLYGSTDITAMQARVAADLRYQEKMSLWVDVKILAQTLWLVVGKLLNKQA
jgi:lipopolysaccharide/colanic/teichoic acid biosynthesis glycosyltransferase